MTLIHRRGLLTVAASALVAQGSPTGLIAGLMDQPSKPVALASMEAVELLPLEGQPPGANSPAGISEPSLSPHSVPAMPALPRWQRYAVAGPTSTSRPGITIVIDDLGVVHPGTERVIAMPAPLTLSWFPFAKNLPAQVAAAAARGHEMTLHMPMQAHSLTTDWTGPDPLRVDLSPAVNMARLRAAIDAVPSTVGINNHMGSVATLDPALMALVARACKEHDLAFLDSVVVAHTQGYTQAAAAGVPATSRDFFIDHSPNPKEILEQLAEIEAHARKWGRVVAIGHPWPHTLSALEAWLPTLKAKGFDLWPLTTTIARRNDIAMPGSSKV